MEAAPSAILLRSASRNYPLDLEPELKGAGYVLTVLASLQDFIASEARGRPQLVLLEVGDRAELDRAASLIDWSEHVQPLAPARYVLLLASKNISLADHAARLSAADAVVLPQPARNILFKLELQGRLLRAPAGGPRGAGEGFLARVEETTGSGRKRVLALRGRGPREGAWREQGNAPSGKVRWRWVSAPAASASADPALAWAAESQTKPRYDEKLGAWLLDGEGDSLVCQKNGETLYSAQAPAEPGPGKKEERKTKDRSDQPELAGEPAKGRVAPGATADPVRDPLPSAFTPAPASLRETPEAGSPKVSGNPLSGENPNPEAKAASPSPQASAASSGKSTLQDPERSFASPAQRDLPDRGKEGAGEKEKNEAGKHGEATPADDEVFPSIREGSRGSPEASTTIAAAERALPASGELRLQEKIAPIATEGKTKPEPSQAPEAKYGPGAAPGANAPGSVRNERERPKEPAEAIASREKIRDELALPAPTRGKNALPSLGDPVPVSLPAPAEAPPRPLAKAPAPAPAEDPCSAKTEFLEERAPAGLPPEAFDDEGGQSTKADRSLVAPSRAANTPPATAAVDPAAPPPPGSPAPEATAKAPGREASPRAPLTVGALAPGPGTAAPKAASRGPAAAPEPADERAGQGGSDDESDARRFLKHRHFELLTLAQLDDQDSSWQPAGRYRIYLSARHRYYGLGMPENALPLWVYDGELAPEFLDRERAWKFYDRLPVRLDSLSALPTETLEALHRICGLAAPGEATPKSANPAVVLLAHAPLAASGGTADPPREPQARALEASGWGKLLAAVKRIFGG